MFWVEQAWRKTRETYLESDDKSPITVNASIIWPNIRKSFVVLHLIIGRPPRFKIPDQVSLNIVPTLS